MENWVSNYYKGWTPSASPLDANTVKTGQQWLANQGLGTMGPNGFQYGGTSANDPKNMMTMGAARGMGYSSDQVSQITGVPVDQINQWMNDPHNAALAQNESWSQANENLYNPTNSVVSQEVADMRKPFVPSAPRDMSGIGATWSDHFLQKHPEADPNAYQKNPYLDEMAKGITSQMTQNWTNNLDPSIRSGAMAAGGFGGSRQGVVEANGLNDLNRSLGQNLTNLYGQDYTNSMNRNLQKYGMDQSYNLGLRANDLGFAGLDAQIAQNNFGNQLAGANFGLNAYGLLNQSNAGATQAGGAIQNTPQQYYNTNLNNLGAISGQGGSNSMSGQGNPWLSAIGGAQMGSKFNLGF